MVGPPRNSQQTTDFTVIHGLRAAIEALAEPTGFQKEYMQKHELPRVSNRGRVICITSARDNLSMSSLETIFHQVLLQQNSMSVKSDHLLKIDFCHLLIINLYPSTESFVNTRPPQDHSSIFRSEIHSHPSAKLPRVLMNLILKHYNLASTTVTNIPMKEEANSSSSANYDVEIFHEVRTHSVFLNAELPRSVISQEGFEYETVTLKWCTPRSGASEMQHCLVQNRITPVDVTSRPSSCLINFLLSGRSVLLEMPRKSGGKTTSHLLSARGGEIFIHSLNTSRSVLEDCPSISEGVGGKIVNYRIPDLVQTTVQQRLVPLKKKYPDENLGKVRARIAKKMSYWPITFNTTIVYNIRQYVEPILVMTQKEDLTEEEVLACQQCIYALVGVEARHDMVLNNQRIKGNKKEDQYRLMWNELEVIVGMNGKSNGHKAILQCIRKVRSAQNPNDNGDSGESSALGGLRKLIDVGGGESSSISAGSLLRSSIDSPMSPPAVTAFKGLKHRATMTLYDIMMAKEHAISSKRMDFSGRLATPDGQIAVLYPHLLTKEAQQAETKA